MSNLSTIKLNNGVQIPVFGLGTWQGVPGKEAEVHQAVIDAIDLGYRLFDCAHVYGNEKSIGDAIQKKISEGIITRDEIFVISKLWNNSHRPDLVELALTRTLKNLQLDYLDLYLIHWPHAYMEGDDLMPKDPETGRPLHSKVDYVDTWKAMESIYEKKLSRAIGVSNFNSKQMQRVLETCKVIPQVNQVECHPYLNQKQLRTVCNNSGIAVMAYCPLGGPRQNVKPGGPDVLTDSRVQDIGNRYKKSPGQILLRYNLQLGNIIIPKSANKDRLAENMDIFDFHLAPEDMAYINSFDCNGRVCRFDEDKDHIHYPFKSDIEF